MIGRIDGILSAPPVDEGAGEELGRSREGRAIRGFRFGDGPFRISLLAGCHADEPVGPWLLRHLRAHLSAAPPDDPLLAGRQWWILPHVNPDGEARNRGWQRGDAEGPHPSAGEGRRPGRDLPERFDLPAYLAEVVREPPGEDLEFGFPAAPDDDGARPEARAAHDWWRSADGPFDLHVSLHGMAWGAGPWFLVEAAWRNRRDRLRERCRARTEALGYRLHDVERLGEKGFVRLGPGFATRPDSRAMKSFFMGKGEPETARLFRPSSMETIRGLGGDPLTLVSEMPLFLVPGVGEALGPPDPVAEVWRGRLERWRAELAAPAPAASDADPADRVRTEARRRGLRSMPVRDQMELQWTLIVAGIEQVEAERGGAGTPAG